MLKQDTINKLAALAKVKPEDLLAAIKAEAEADLTIDDKLTTYSEDDLKTLKTNTYNDGKKAGVEMNVDEVKKELGLEFQGKTIKGLVEAATKKAITDAKLEPAEQVKQLTEKLTALQKTVGDQEKQILAKDAEVTSVKTKGEVYKYIPEFGENAPALGRDEIIGLMGANGYEPKIENGNLVFYKGGQLVADKLQNPVAAKDVVSGFLKEKKLITDAQPTPGGRGAGDQRPAGKFGKLSELKKSFEDQGKSVLGQEFSDAVSKAATENKEFDLST